MIPRAFLDRLICQVQFDASIGGFNFMNIFSKILDMYSCVANSCTQSKYVARSTVPWCDKWFTDEFNRVTVHI